jgi:hypothetical protein
MGNHYNEGIWISGGRIEAGALAVGRGASVGTVTGMSSDPGREEIAQRLDELLRRLATEGDRLRDRDEVREATQVVVDELGKQQPNKTTVTGVLTGIAGAVTSVAGLATATDALLAAVRQFL